jgi:hypothetical protein
MTAEATGQKPGAEQEQADSGEPAWRGIATEEVDEVSAPLAALLRRRSRALLSDLMRLRARARTGLEDRKLRIAQASTFRDLLREDPTLALAYILLESPEKIDSLDSGGIIKAVGEQVAAYAPGSTWVKTAQLLEKTFGELPDDEKRAMIDRICKVMTEFGQKPTAEHLQETYKWQ